MTVTRALQGETVDAIAARIYGPRAAMVEALLEANPGLADLGAELPAGLAVTLPPPPAPVVRRPVRLWD